MTDISSSLQRFATATEVADVLDGACEVFEGILAVLRLHREDEVSAFPAFVLAACAAANGRDWTGGEWTRRADGPEQDTAPQLMGDAAIAEVARIIAAASDELAARLSECPKTVGDEAYRECCEHAAAEAATIHALLSGASPP